MRIGVVGSSGGSVFLETYRILQEQGEGHEFCVVTDRPCGLQDLCRAHGITHHHIEDRDNAGFSRKAREAFEAFGGVDYVMLFYLRLVTSELFEAYPTFNIHPSLLPAFPGFSPIRRALEARAKFLGATLHLVDDSVDAGAIVAQTVAPIGSRDTEAMLEKVSFLQKTYLSLVLAELFQREAMRFTQGYRGFEWQIDLPASDRANPMLTLPALRQGYDALLAREAMEGVV